MKVDKRRKKKAAEEADARADAVFAEEVRSMQQGKSPPVECTARVRAAAFLPVLGWRLRTSAA